MEKLHGQKMPPNVQKCILKNGISQIISQEAYLKKYSKLQPQDSPNMAFHAFNNCTFWDSVSKVTDSQKHFRMNFRMNTQS